MRTFLMATAGVALLAACSPTRPAAEGSSPAPCAGTRVLVVQNGAEEAVNVFALNGRTSTEIGTAAPGKKEITLASTLRATSFYATAVSRQVFAGSPQAAPTDTRVSFTLECR